MKVGLIGCGRAAVEGHLPAYRKYNVEVVGVCDIIRDRAKKVAAQFKVPFYCDNFLDLASKQNVEIIDIATRPEGRAKLLHALLPFNKPMLVQKPITYDLGAARRLHYEFEKAGVPIAINHNARWAPVQLKIAEYIKDGSLGEIYSIHHVNRNNENFRIWFTDHPDYMFLDHGLHFIDLVKVHTGLMPDAVSAISGRSSIQVAKCLLLYSINMRYDSQPSLAVSLYFNNNAPAPPAFHYMWYIDGSNCSIHATANNIMRIYSNGNKVKTEAISGDWIPDGFWGAYNSFKHALERGLEPPHSLRDHLETLKIAKAAAYSANHKGMWVSVKNKFKGY